MSPFTQKLKTIQKLRKGDSLYVKELTFNKKLSSLSLRCLTSVIRRLQSPRQQTDSVDCGSDVTMTPMSQAFQKGQVQDDDSVRSSSASSPPAKPQRSFRQKRDEQLETAAYPEAYKKEREPGGEGGGSQDETHDKKCREEKDGEVSREEKKGRRQEEEEEGKTTEDKAQKRGNEEAAGGDEAERRGHERREEEEGCRDEKEGEEAKEEEGEDSQQSDTEDDETRDKTQVGGESAPSPPPHPARHSRVIRLYQYDEDGQRYRHLPDPAPNDSGPAPRAKQRSVCLTRLNAIMAAATAGPLDRRDTGQEEKSQFHMDK